MVERLYLAAVLVFFILAFAVKNIKTWLATRQSIRGKSVKVNASIFLSTAIYALILLRLIFNQPAWLVEFSFSSTLPGNVGVVLVSVGFVLGILALVSMRNSWRVGIKHEQKTELITSGIYRISRNPYFLSYNILILGFILIFPSPVLALLYLSLVVVFHQMILEEEQYLLKVHGQNYEAYRQKTGRYFTFR